MIPQAFITQWRHHAPWQENYQVEQDLLIERALVAIFSESELRTQLAYRGGTALHKLYFQTQVRYSEDIDLVQIKPEPFGPVIDKLRESLGWLGKPAVKQKQHNNTMVFRVASEDGIPLRLKVETNCREHFTVLGLTELQREVKSAWFEGRAAIPTYDIHELLATKLRALYQRRKGRDLFDLWYAFSQQQLDGEKIIEVWRRYMAAENQQVSRSNFINNLEAKMKDSDFLVDTAGLLSARVAYNPAAAFHMVRSKLLERV